MDKTALKVAGSVFLIVALVHLARLVFSWAVTLNGREIPIWISGPAFLVMLALAIGMFWAAGSKK